MANAYFNQFYFSPLNYLVGLHGYADLVAPVLAAVTGQGITYTAVALGAAGDGVAVTIVGGGTAGAEVVTVNGKEVEIQVESGVSTRTQVKAAWDGTPAALALATVSVASGSTTVAPAAAVITTGGVDSVSSFYMPGVGSIEHAGTGLYDITLKETYPELVSSAMQILAASAVDLVPQLVSQAVSSTKVIRLRLNAGATPTNPAAATRLYIGLHLRNSDQRY